MNQLHLLKNNPKFSKELPADELGKNHSRSVFNACFSYVNPVTPSNPELIHQSSDFLNKYGLSLGEKSLAILSGKENFTDFKPYAMCYGGHQFGHWAGQLGDGRAINIGEIDLKGEHLKFQLKGAGPTPYSRGADGFAVLRSSIREYLCSEAMFHLGIPTSRALSLVKTGDDVLRDMLYNGNRKNEQGAILCRVAPSFIRFGSFELLAARKDNENLKKLTDYTIKHHYPHLGKLSKSTYLNFFKEVCTRTKTMIMHWQRVGFVHGVMNTDNMSILGQTIDYGPYGWLENFDLGWTPNTTDAQNKRYRYENQPEIGLWNLTQLANAIYPLIEDVEAIKNVLRSYRSEIQDELNEVLCHKIGLYTPIENDKELIKELQLLLQKTALDMTLFYRKLGNFKDVNHFLMIIEKISYLEKEEFNPFIQEWKNWLENYVKRLKQEKMNSEERKAKMNKINPKYVLRNYMAQLAIEDAEKGDYSLIDEFYQLLRKPYDEQPNKEKWFVKRPKWADNKVGCSMLSCSS